MEWVLILGPSTWADQIKNCDAKSQSPVDLIANAEGTFDALKFSKAWYNEVKGELFDNGHTGCLT